MSSGEIDEGGLNNQIPQSDTGDRILLIRVDFDFDL